MQVQKIQNNSSNTNFHAKIQITGHFDDIGKKNMRIWENKAKSIGTSQDLITLHFGYPMRERGDVFENGQFHSWFANFRAIYASVNMKGKELYKNKYIGYRVLNKQHSEEICNKQVSEFFSELENLNK